MRSVCRDNGGIMMLAAATASIILCYQQNEQTNVKNEYNSSPKTSIKSNGESNKLLFLGTGSSTGCPRPLCAMLFPPHGNRNKDPSALQKQYESFCEVSRLAVQGNPAHNKNYRNNPSILISHIQKDTRHNIIIDVGKTFREGAIRWMPENDISSLDAILLTHEHMDAAGGLDDVRGFQIREKGIGALKPISVFLTSQTLRAIRKQFHYLVPPQQQAMQAVPTEKTPAVKRLVAALDFQIIEPFQPFIAGGMTFIPLPVMHGEDMVCMGFAFSIPILLSSSNVEDATTLNSTTTRDTSLPKKEAVHVLYLSDISRMLPETEHYILTQLPPTDILVIDSLHRNSPNSTHMCMREALGFAEGLKPNQKTYLVGMNCDDFLPNDEMNELLQSTIKNKDKILDVELAHDGLVLEF